MQALSFPIRYDDESHSFSGWFIRENKTFTLDLKTLSGQVEGQSFKISQQDILAENGDIFVPLNDLTAWFGIEFETNLGDQKLALDPTVQLPAQERAARRKNKIRGNTRKPPSLPRGDDDYEFVDIPFIDVNTVSSFTKSDGQSSDTRRTVNVRSAGEFAYGSLSTNVSANDEDNITSARVTYLQEHADPVLLGALKARRFEVGDLTPTRLPLTGSAPQEMGVRVTNANPLISQTLPITQISGYIFPGWDVELYRNNSLVAFQETDDSGFYSFDNVRLLSNRNFFRVVSYGPQGEVREETLNVPFNQNREARGEGIYDLSITAQESETFRKLDTDDQDENTLHLAGFYEMPVGDKSAVRLGVRSRQEEGEQKTYGNATLFTVVGQTQTSLDLAADEQGEAAASLALNRQFGDHSFTSDFRANTEEYNPGQEGTAVGSVSTVQTLEGPLPFALGESPRYQASLQYSDSSNGLSRFNGFLNLNTRMKNLGLNQTLQYNNISGGSANSDEADMTGVTSVSGSYGKNFIRALAGYDISPQAEIENLTAFWRRRVHENLDTQLQVDRLVDTSTNSYSAQLDWRPDYALISPRLSYDDNGNLQALVSTRFGINPSSENGGVIFSKDTFTRTGTIDAFVFLDKDGDLVFNGEDEPIEDARIVTPQNSSGRNITNEDGVASVSRLRPNIMTDVFVDESSLADPFWISAKKGQSLLPRTGTRLKINFPIHLAGEVDGTVFLQKPDGKKAFVSSVRVNLHNKKGELIKSTLTGPDGFYVLDLVPPGEYVLLVDAKTIPSNTLRPRPQEIKIGHDGEPIYGNDITLAKGAEDVPSRVMASLASIKARHPHVAFDEIEPDIVLNLGDYNSNLAMSLAWYSLKLRYGKALRGGQVLVRPGESYSDQSGKHTLRVAISSETIDGAYKRCSFLVARNVACEVEILPGALDQLASVANKKAL